MNTSAPTSSLAAQHRLITVSQAARLLEVHVSTVRRWITQGSLPAYRVGNKGIRIHSDDVLALLTPVQSRKGERIAQPEHAHGGLLTREEQQRGLAALRELEELDREDGDELLPDSADLLQQLREDCTRELMRKLEE